MNNVKIYIDGGMKFFYVEFIKLFIVAHFFNSF